MAAPAARRLLPNEHPRCGCQRQAFGSGARYGGARIEFRSGEPAAAAPQANSPERGTSNAGILGPACRMEVKAAGLEVVHPALVAVPEGVAIRLLDHPGEATLAHEDGLVALATGGHQALKSLRKSLLAGSWCWLWRR